MSVKQRGDTIVEVLLAMAVVGMVLGSSFGIANRSLNIGRSAQERTQALKIAESQLELMKLAEEANPGDVSNRDAPDNFCLHTSSGSIALVDESDSACKDINGSGGAGLYTVSIRPDGFDSSKVYEIRITWERLGASGSDADNRLDELSLYYKIGIL